MSQCDRTGFSLSPNCVGERVGVRGHRTEFFISPLTCVAR